ncbi:MAG: hypothetical protein IPL03_10950 [Sterolibacteriaceae bacterium]|nr:hypothetical protein [Candidatus Methylophosphatis haderslevensis]
MITASVALPDGRLAWSVDGTVRIWHPDGVREPRALVGHADRITIMVALPDGRLASDSNDGTVRIWDPEGVREPWVLEGHTDRISTLVALPGGRLASGSTDGTVRIWNTHSGRDITLFVADAGVSALAATKADTLAAGDATGAVHFLKLHV